MTYYAGLDVAITEIGLEQEIRGLFKIFGIKLRAWMIPLASSSPGRSLRTSA